METTGTFTAATQINKEDKRIRRLVVFRTYGTKREGARAFLAFIERNKHLAGLPLEFRFQPQEEYVNSDDLSRLVNGKL